MADTITPSDGFAAAMQQLSAEAEKSLPASGLKREGSVVSDAVLTHLSREVEALAARFERLEETLSARIDKLASTVTTGKTVDFADAFQKIGNQLNAIRSCESVNQRVFDSLHDELLKYRDNFLHESLQKPFIHDLVMLFDDLNSLSEQLRTAAYTETQRGHITQWRDNLENAVHSLLEILHRFEVKEIEPKERVDRTLHRVVSYEPANFAEEDGCIVMRVRRGFFWRGKLIRPEEVIAKRFD
jgi:molecular chaperone GrpE (heat shock protein)